MKLLVLKEIIIEVDSIEEADRILDEHAESIVAATLEEDLDGTGDPKIIAAARFVTETYFEHVGIGPPFPDTTSQRETDLADLSYRADLMSEQGPDGYTI